MRKKPRMSLVLRMAKPVSASTLFPPRRKPSGVKSGRSPQCGSSRDETVGLAPQSWTNFISEGVGSFMSMFKNKHIFLENGDEYLKNAKEKKSTAPMSMKGMNYCKKSSFVHVCTLNYIFKPPTSNCVLGQCHLQIPSIKLPIITALDRTPT